MKVADRNLRRLVTEFRKGILARRRSNGFCWVVASALEGYLRFIGHDCQLTEGWVGDHSHFWITLSDRRIIDPTADQFKTPAGHKMSKVYIGQKPKWYRVDSKRSTRLANILTSLAGA